MRVKGPWFCVPPLPPIPMRCEIFVSINLKFWWLWFFSVCTVHSPKFRIGKKSWIERSIVCKTTLADASRYLVCASRKLIKVYCQTNRLKTSEINFIARSLSSISSGSNCRESPGIDFITFEE